MRRIFCAAMPGAPFDRIETAKDVGSRANRGTYAGNAKRRMVVMQSGVLGPGQGRARTQTAAAPRRGSRRAQRCGLAYWPSLPPPSMPPRVAMIEGIGAGAGAGAGFLAAGLRAAVFFTACLAFAFTVFFFLAGAARFTAFLAFFAFAFLRFFAMTFVLRNGSTTLTHADVSEAADAIEGAAKPRFPSRPRQPLRCLRPDR